MAAETPSTPYLALKAEPKRLTSLMMRLDLIAATCRSVVVSLTRMDTPTTTEPGETEVMLTWERVRLRSFAMADCTSALKADICVEMLL